MLKLKNVAFGDLTTEHQKTRTLLERVPDEHWGWKPHHKSMALGELAAHLVNVCFWQVGILEDDEFDLAGIPEVKREIPTNREQLLDLFDRHRANVTSVVENIEEELLGKTWTLRHGDHEILAMPKVFVMRMMGISHMVHHRAQLGVYLRMLDVPLPPTYGPTADEQGTF